MGLFLVFMLILIGLLVFFTPFLAHWGSHPDEYTQKLAGDHWIPLPLYRTTRSVLIQAEPKRVWPWLLQIGQNRSGFYSYTILENLFGLRIHNTQELFPEWQQLQIGDLVKLHPKGGFIVGEMVEQKNLVLLGNERSMQGIAQTLINFVPEAVWSFHLFPDGPHTRLLVRTIGRPSGNRFLDFMLPYGLGFVSFLMEQKMLRTIKKLAEKTTMDQVRSTLQRDQIKPLSELP